MNKGELRAHMKALLNRSDCTDALADTFIDQASPDDMYREAKLSSKDIQEKVLETLAVSTLKVRA